MMNMEHILKLVQSGDVDVSEAKRLLEEAAEAAQQQPDLAEKAVIAETVMNTGQPSAAIVPQQAALNVSGIDDTLGYAQLDVNRSARTGFPEVIFGEGKTAEQIAAIMERLALHNDSVLATRVSPEKAVVVMERWPGAIYREDARALLWSRSGLPSTPADPAAPFIAVVCAGTSDVPVAEEAAVTAEHFGARVERIYDVGVAGIHRLFRRLPLIQQADCVVVCAGMEGALASVLGGLVSVPVYAVPTSIGYGASFQGVAALLAMLNACAPGISVVNIDNGFGAGYNAALVLKSRTKRDES
ncbi:nickel pincer cofactor biosynthesis protein LarB [Paenibacillus sp. YYML68]|uniref:nickel pincer cofactor biosynthesis protein LarB n=1 Tax=Paenibacillus sp. YYML68 TaxID=2909250 RepID=UPI00249019F9|nr:nickel pincer cofactor biosynthesis protein LarB [Paenibacillus sp. YYML68]